MASSLYVFEGPDGVGKSTLAKLLANTLTQQNRDVELLSFPGRDKGTLGNHVYNLYHDKELFGVENISVSSEQLLFTAAHADVIQNQILPTLSRGADVVLDRYWWSTWVYAKFGCLDEEMLELLLRIEFLLWKGTQPKCIFNVVREQSTLEYSISEWGRLTSLYADIRRNEASKSRIVDVINDDSLQHALNVIVSTLD